MTKSIACTHPGKMGDAIWALPAIKKLCEIMEVKADFYTSDYCAPLKNLFEYQSYIDNFYVATNYKIERMDMGVQPFRVPVDMSLYSKVYHMGFRRVPDRPISDFIAFEIGLDSVDPIQLECPLIAPFESPYYVVAPRGDTTFKKTFIDFINNSRYDCIIVGGKGDFIGAGIDCTGMDFLETASYIKNSKGFVGLMSSQLVIANAFPIHKVVLHDGHSWDMRHVMRSRLHHYIVTNCSDQIQDILKVST